MRLVIWVILAIVLGGMTYIRLAPHDVEKVHRSLEFERDADFDAGAQRQIVADLEKFLAAVGHMQSLPRTRILAGSPESGRVTFVTRSLIFGFPDYTTLEYSNDRLRIYARLRFGRSDLGVNRARLEGVLSALKG